MGHSSPDLFQPCPFEPRYLSLFTARDKEEARYVARWDGAQQGAGGNCGSHLQQSGGESHFGVNKKKNGEGVRWRLS